MEGEKFKAVCAECGQECEIPFNPTEGRPVKCDACFRKVRDSRGGNRRFQERRDFSVVCAECGRATTVPFKPVQGKPVLCRDCFKGK
ncbi:zinc-binding protein [Candidatus Pacearchaeota archaeon]|nr:zinc-binding protein [Candidatus Pacearchaeota archaeon]